MNNWPSKDPLGERGGLNLYRFMTNDGVNAIDYLGMVQFNFPIDIPDFNIPIPDFGFNWRDWLPDWDPELPSLNFNSWHSTFHDIHIFIPLTTDEDIDAAYNQIYSDLTRFKYFRPNRAGDVTFENAQLAKFRGPHWPPATTMQAVGAYLFSDITDLTFYNKVSLSFDSEGKQVTGETLPGHILEGTRHWQVTQDDQNPCLFKIKTWARERTANSLNHGGRVLFNIVWGDIQDQVWDDYLNNIGNHWKNSKNARIVKTP